MPRCGLSREEVLKAAAELIEESGLDRFSMGELARRLNVKAASLYNHVAGIDELMDEVGLLAIGRLAQAEGAAIEAKRADEALFALAEAYRSFARSHYELYRVIMGLARRDDCALKRGADEMLEPIMKVLATYRLGDEQRYHWQRVLRGVMVGFAVHERAGGFSHLPVDENESYRIAIQCVADGLNRAGEGTNEDERADTV